MNQRENFFAMLNGEKPEYVPCTGMYCKMFFIPGDVEGTNFVGVDGFGVNWIDEKTGQIPEPGKFLFEDMADWKKYVKFPDIDSIDYKAIAAAELADYNRDEQILYTTNSCIGSFTRLNSLMGFENALIALVSEPEACLEFFDALADFQVKRINKIIDAYQPDVMWYTDDLAHAKGLFMSPETYYDIIRPSSKKMINAITSRGVICNFHCCGKCESIVDDFVQLGCRMWNPAQITNDLVGIEKKYGNRLIIEGGWDTQGRPGTPEATEQEIVDEVVRCVDTYGKFGNYIMLPVMFNEKGNSLVVGDSRLPALAATFARVNALV